MSSHLQIIIWTTLDQKERTLLFKFSNKQTSNILESAMENPPLLRYQFFFFLVHGTYGLKRLMCLKCNSCLASCLDFKLCPHPVSILSPVTHSAFIWIPFPDCQTDFEPTQCSNHYHVQVKDVLPIFTFSPRWHQYCDVPLSDDKDQKWLWYLAAIPHEEFFVGTSCGARLTSSPPYNSLSNILNHKVRRPSHSFHKSWSWSF